MYVDGPVFAMTCDHPNETNDEPGYGKDGDFECDLGGLAAETTRTLKADADRRR